MEEITKALGPWPFLQFVFGVVVLGLGVWSISRGLKGKEEKSFQIEDKRAEWAAYDQLKNIEENTFKMVENQKILGENQKSIVESVNRLTSVLWNRDQR
jgi:hypothetical protein